MSAILLTAHEDHLTVHIDGSIIGRIRWNDYDCVWEFKHDRKNFAIYECTLNKISLAIRKWIDDGMPI